MIFVKIAPYTGLPDAVANNLTADERADRCWQSAWDWKDFETVEWLARYATALTGITYLPVDRGPSVSPRYDLIKAPVVGEDVSMGFNGDYYPCGKITKITKGWRVTTSDGTIFNRRGNTAGWREVRGSFYLVHGIVDRLNPSF